MATNAMLNNFRDAVSIHPSTLAHLFHLAQPEDWRFNVFQLTQWDIPDPRPDIPTGLYYYMMNRLAFAWNAAVTAQPEFAKTGGYLDTGLLSKAGYKIAALIQPITGAAKQLAITHLDLVIEIDSDGATVHIPCAESPSSAAAPPPSATPTADISIPPESVLPRVCFVGEQKPNTMVKDKVSDSRAVLIRPEHISAELMAAPIVHYVNTISERCPEHKHTPAHAISDTRLLTPLWLHGKPHYADPVLMLDCSSDRFVVVSITTMNTAYRLARFCGPVTSDWLQPHIVAEASADRTDEEFSALIDRLVHSSPYRYMELVAMLDALRSDQQTIDVSDTRAKLPSIVKYTSMLMVFDSLLTCRLEGVASYRYYDVVSSIIIAEVNRVMNTMPEYIKCHPMWATVTKRVTDLQDQLALINVLSDEDGNIQHPFIQPSEWKQDMRLMTEHPSHIYTLPFSDNLDTGIVVMFDYSAHTYYMMITSRIDATV